MSDREGCYQKRDERQNGRRKKGKMKIPWNVKKKKTVPGPTYAGLGKLQLSLLPSTSPHTKPINPRLRGPCKMPPFQKPGPQTSTSGGERWPLRLILEERQIAYVLTCELLMAVFSAAAFSCRPGAVLRITPSSNGIACGSRGPFDHFP